jgi:dipeptidyl aminopeptidase/acylaminoacyl peptidase
MKMQGLLIAACLAAAAAFADDAPARHPITHEDLWLMKRVGAPALSPDGRLVVFPVAEPAYDDSQKSSDLWLVPADGSAAPRRLTFTNGGESGLAWSPDSRRIAFAAKREGQDDSQVYVLDIAAGGEAERVTSAATGASRPVWRPDGQAILFSSMTYPGALNDADNKARIDEKKARKYGARVYDSFPIRHWDRWLDERRPTLMLQVLGDRSAAKDLLAGTALRNAPGFGGDLDNDGDQIDAAWTPDGGRIVFTATSDRDRSARTDVQQSLYVMPAGGGEPTRLTGDEASFSQPAFSADGRTLFARSNAHNRFVYNDDRLVRFDFGDSAAKPVVYPFKRSVGSFELAPGGSVVYLVAEDEGHDRIFSVPVAGGEVREIGRLETGSFGGLQVGGSAEAPVIVANWGSAVSPAEVMRIDPSSGARRALSSFNAERSASIDWQPIREFWFESKRGRRIHNMIALPPGFDPAKKYPLYLILHGGPHNGVYDSWTFRWNAEVFSSWGYVTAWHNFHGSSGFGQKFADSINPDLISMPYEDTIKAAEWFESKPWIDSDRMAAGGGSYGGFLAATLLGRPHPFKTLIAHAAVYDNYAMYGGDYGAEKARFFEAWEKPDEFAKYSPATSAANFKTPTLVIHGQLDQRVPLNNGMELFQILQNKGVPSRLVYFPDENHWVLKRQNSLFWYSEVKNWLEHYVPAGAR